jgi:outer membrane protein
MKRVQIGSVAAAAMAMAAAFVIATSMPAVAADVAPAATSPSILTSTPSSEWIVTIGVEGRVMPKFEGADSAMFRPLPILRVRRADKPDQFRSSRDGLSVAILDTGNFKLGPTANFRFGRKESDDSSLRGLGDVNWAFEAGAFAEYWPTGWLRTRLEVRQGFGGHHGVIGDLNADLVFPVTTQLTLSGGPRLTAGTAASMSPYFSITPAQAALSGLPAYDARGGVRSYGLGTQATYTFNRQWATAIFFEYERLAGDAANSPLVTLRGSRDQIQVGIDLTYSFNIPGLW